VGAFAFSPRNVEDWQVVQGLFRGQPTCNMISVGEAGSALVVGVSDIIPFAITILGPSMPAHELVSAFLIMRTGGREFIMHGMAADPRRLAVSARMGVAIEPPRGDETEAVRRFFGALREGAENIEVQFPDDTRMYFPARGGRKAVTLLYDCGRPPT
jgi:hypothetical protein